MKTQAVHVNLKKLREDFRLSILEMAAIFDGIDAEMIQKWEDGELEPDIKQVIKIAEHFQVDYNELFYGSKEEENKESLGCGAIVGLSFLALLILFALAVAIGFEWAMLIGLALVSGVTIVAFSNISNKISK